MTTAIRIHEFGGPDVLRADDVDLPEPGPGQLLVRVDAASVNPVDAKIRQGPFPPVGEDRLPYTMGRDLSGIVERAGEGVDSFERGARVHAMLDVARGAYAQRAIVEVGEAAAPPTEMDAAAAAALPLAGMTAWQGLVDHGGLAEGETVLVHGGAGGVGHLAVQIAKARGARVITTAREEDRERLEELGADEVIDHRSERFEDRVSDLHLVLDLVGGEVQERSFDVLKPGGRLVSTLGEPSQDRAAEAGVSATRFMARPDSACLEELDRLVYAGQLRPVVARRFALDEAAEAQEALEGEHVFGKLVLAVG